MIVYINERLNQWADWRLRHEDNGIGYPRQCPYTRMTPSSGSGFYSPELNEAAMEIDTAVCALPDNLRLVVMVMYTRTSTCKQKARDCQVAERTFFDRLHRAHVLLMEHLNDMVNDMAAKDDVRIHTLRILQSV